MILKGQIYATEDIEHAMMCLTSGAKIIYIGEPDQDLNRATNNSLICIPLLTPPYEALRAVLENDIAKFSLMYTEHLNTKECQLLIASIVAALYKGFMVILLFPKDTKELLYPDFLIKFFITNLGIQIGSDKIQYAFNPIFDDVNLDILYRHNIISPQEYVFNCTNITQLSLQKLIADLNIRVQNPNDISQYIKWVEEYHDRMVLANRLLTVQPFVCDPYYKKED